MRRAAALIALAPAALALAACGQSTIIPSKSEQVVRDFVYQHTGVRATNVTCPSGVPAKKGGTFDCHFTAPDGYYVAHITIESVNGTSVDNYIVTRPLVNYVRADGAASEVTQFVDAKTGFRPTDVTCPSGIPAKVGGTYDCHFTGPDGPYVAHVRITTVDGEHIGSYITTERSAG
jgi:hypothetical protein